ncbi:MAG TPA: ABC transporter substrate-binding protein, partial [Gammaproteobacteria bacterium]|nr:ABC transporter substrate-binding protein [Gammaproteobacteria bacterium]
MLIRLVTLVGLLLGMQNLQASEWKDIERQARGQTVYFYAWGGSPSINQYIKRWSTFVKERSGVTVNHVKVDDISLAIQGIQTAKRIGKSDEGSVDVLWINGENFARMKRDGLFGESFVSALPSAKNINLDDPTIVADFSVTTDGLEAPWGRARLVFIYDQERISNPPRSMKEMYEYAKEHPGRLTYPEPPNFHGTTFLKQALLETTQHI